MNGGHLGNKKLFIKHKSPSDRTQDSGEYAIVEELNEEYVQISRHDLLHILVTDTHTLEFQYIHLNFF
jgi:hypothetical protein